MVENALPKIARALPRHLRIDILRFWAGDKVELAGHGEEQNREKAANAINRTSWIA